MIEYGARRGRLDRRGLSEMPPRLEAEQIEALGTGDLGEGMGKGRGLWWRQACGHVLLGF